MSIESRSTNNNCDDQSIWNECCWSHPLRFEVHDINIQLTDASSTQKIDCLFNQVMTRVKACEEDGQKAIENFLKKGPSINKNPTVWMLEELHNWEIEKSNAFLNKVFLGICVCIALLGIGLVISGILLINPTLAVLGILALVTSVLILPAARD